MSASNILALDAAYGRAAACLVRKDGKRFHAEGEDDQPHSQGILPMLESLLSQAAVDWKQLDMLAAGIGPGSFTGLRVAAATIAGINASLDLPVLSMSSLAITAMQTETSDEVWVIEDARAGDAYIGLYRQGKPMQADACMAWSKIGRISPGVMACQTKPTLEMKGWHQLDLHLSRPEAMSELITLLVKNVSACDLPRHVIPEYIRPSQAEKNAGHD